MERLEEKQTSTNPQIVEDSSNYVYFLKASKLQYYLLVYDIIKIKMFFLFICRIKASKLLILNLLEKTSLSRSEVRYFNR